MLFAVEDLSVGYGTNMILNGVSLNVDLSETVSVLGPNGAGKSTLLKAIMGVLRPKTGKVILEDKEITGLQPGSLLRLGIGYANVGRGVVPGMTVLENLMIGAFTINDSGTISKNLQKVFELFPALKKYENKKGGLLSGGEQQMLALGAALMLDPKILLLDEPSVGLAPQFQDLIFKRIEDLKATGVSILMVEQNVYRALEVSDRGYVLEMGTVRFQGKSNE